MANFCDVIARCYRTRGYLGISLTVVSVIVLGYETCRHPQFQGLILEPNKTTYGDGERVEVSCKVEYKFNKNHESTAICRASEGRYFKTDIMPDTCKELSHCEPPKGAGIQIKNRKNLYEEGETIVVFCDAGYELVETETFTCKTQYIADFSRRNTTFGSDAYAACREIRDCQPPEQTGLIFEPVKKAYKPGDKIQLSCKKNYELRAEGVATCHSTGHFRFSKKNSQDSFIHPKQLCKISGCLALEQIGLLLQPNKTVYQIGDYVSLACEDNFQLTINNTATCQYTGLFEFRESDVEESEINFNQVCKLQGCLAPNQKGLVFEPKKVTYDIGETIRLACKRTYTLTVQEYSTCMPSLRFEFVGNYIYQASADLERVCRRPLIAYWAGFHHPVVWKFPELPNGDGGCDLSFERKDVAKADAVVFNMVTCNPNDLPPATTRRADQVYVWFSQESPWTTINFYKHLLTGFNDYFNFTMTYRSDSDVNSPMRPTPSMDYLLYGMGKKEEMLDKNLMERATLSENEFEKQVDSLISNKNKLVAWIASDCDVTTGASKRKQIVADMEKSGLKVSKYGACAGKYLPYSFRGLFKTLSPFKFYLAFENSLHCKDYVTEKTAYNGFVAGTVPVIYGPRRADVQRILPKGSYIFVEDYINMKELTDYLHYLDKNDTAYEEYFKWWMNPGAQTFPRFGFSLEPISQNWSLPRYKNDEFDDDWLEYERFGLYHLCRRLKRGDHLYQTHVVHDLAKWWYGDETPECISTR